MARIVFYCHAKRDMLESVEFYKQDIEALRGLGHEVVVCTQYREIPLRFDALYIWWWTHALWPALLARVLGKPAIITGVMNFRFPAGFEGMDYFARPWHQKLLIKMAVKTAALNVFISRFEAEPCAEYFKLPVPRFCHLTLHEDYLQGPGPDRELSILNIAWSGKQNLIRKGVPELLGAVKLLKDEGHDTLKVYLAGHRGDGFEDLEARIAKLGLTENVQLLGEVSREEKIRYLRSCEIYAQPSHFEGFGLAMAEALGSGACVVTCPVGAVEEVVGDAGIYVQAGSITALAEGLRTALADAQLRTQYQTLAVERTRRMYSKGMKDTFMKDLLASVNLR